MKGKEIEAIADILHKRERIIQNGDLKGLGFFHKPDIVEDLIDFFKSENPRFKASRFRANCYREKGDSYYDPRSK